MKNLKPSQLPENTVIRTIAPHYEELYIKKANGVWEDLFSGYGCCVDSEKIGDDGCAKEERWHQPYGLTTTKSSDEYFTDFKIIAVDPEVRFDSEALHGVFVDGIGGYADGTRPHDCKGYNCEV